MGLRLFCLPNLPVATFIQGGTFIPGSRVVQFSKCKNFLTSNSKKCVVLLSTSEVAKLDDISRYGAQ